MFKVRKVDVRELLLGKIFRAQHGNHLSTLQPKTDCTRDYVNIRLLVIDKCSYNMSVSKLARVKIVWASVHNIFQCLNG